MAIASSMNPKLVSRGDSFTRNESLTIPQADAEHGGRKPATTCKIRAPIDQFFRGSELGKWLLTLDGGALVAILGFHPNSLLPQKYLPAIIILLLVGLTTLFSGLLFQEASPEFAVVMVLVGTACVIATFLIMVAAILPHELCPVVWVFVAVLFGILVVLLYVIARKGMRELVVDYDNKLE